MFIKKLIGFSNDFLNKLDEKFTKKDYKGVLLYCLSFVAIIISASAAILAVVIAGEKMGHVIVENWKFILGAGIIGVWGYLAITTKMQEKRDVAAEQKAREDLETELSQQRLSEQNYQTARQILFCILENIAPTCGLERPEELSSLDAPRHCTVKNGATFLNYVAVKNGEINVRKVTTMIETRFEQLADAGEIDISPSRIMLFGQIYPALMVDSVQDMGSFLQIRLIFPNSSYIQQRTARDRQNHLPPRSGGGNDHDF